jgi:hypothetical protein
MRGIKRQAEGEGVAVTFRNAITMARVSPPRKLFMRLQLNGGVDGARTRDLRRDRPAF